ncbi:hypothetical protein FEDK69T_05510 [Flavobacterium enshiense DK69]|uniref:DUF4349 domain-containing protein n=1 Tax=Flavobacterium enshiense DK69 TaxID=1107311 RepID=V6SDS8_9FLAO|nr:DUF4349 domain-containing protein [Flavobacterium enshiense]ESU24629.1 hypothetical protein FEDK69T_05510 [Flavobacterium enshiense DK69]KGO95504.1 hypothetical protein Q767_11940 [Flavobacterium enshiense DK69]
MRTLFLCLSLLLITAACKKAVSEDKMMVVSDNDETVAAASEEVVMEASIPPPPGEYSEAKMEAANIVKKDNHQPKIIKTGTLCFESSNLDQSFTTVKAAIIKHKASVQNDASGKNDALVFRNITIRVPSQAFDNLIAEISQGVNHFDRKEISAEDVTEEYIDVEARLNAKRVLEKRYFELLAKATKVSEMLEIENSLSEVREEIEAKEGRLKYLQNQVSMSTVHLEMYTNNPSESGATASYFGKMGNAAKEGFNNAATFFLGALYLWPFILIFLAGFFLVKKRFRRKTA